MVEGIGRSHESLQSKIAEDVWPKFSEKPNAPVMSVSPAGTFAIAQVHNGNLDILVTVIFTPGGDVPPRLPDSARVVWTVDTGADGG